MSEDPMERIIADALDHAGIGYVRETANPSRLDFRVSDAVQAAISRLMQTRSWGDSTFVTMPLFYPNGTPVTVKVEPAPTGFRVSDGGLTFREFEQVGAESYYGRNASNFAREIEGFVHNRSLCLDVEQEELTAAIADVADAVARMANKVMSKVMGKGGEAEIARKAAAKRWEKPVQS